MTTQAYFLVAHGSRSPHPQKSLARLADFVRAATMDSPVEAIGTGCLEFEHQSLAEQLLQFQASLSASCQSIHILPVFLLPGNHVCSDIPVEIHRAQAKLAQTHPNTRLLLTPHLGSHPALKQILLDTMAETSPEAWILVGHGSRRSAGNRAIEQLAKSINAQPAFWAVNPGLIEQVEALVSQGIRSIGIIPFFLFSGKITAAIAEQVEAISHEYRGLHFELLSPFEPSPELAAPLIELAQLTAIDIPHSTLTH